MGDIVKYLKCDAYLLSVAVNNNIVEQKHENSTSSIESRLYWTQNLRHQTKSFSVLR